MAASRALWNDTQAGFLWKDRRSGRGLLRLVLGAYPQPAADTHADNAVMQRLLEGAGFVRCGIIYTDDGSPRIAYQKYAAG